LTDSLVIPIMHR